MKYVHVSRGAEALRTALIATVLLVGPFGIPDAALAVPITCGQTLQGTIAVAGETDVFTFTGDVGDVVSITISQTGGTDTPCWSLIGPDASPIGSTVCEANALRTLGADGVHTILVSESGNNQPAAYGLSLEAMNATFDGGVNAPPNPVCGAIDVLGNQPADDGTQPIACGQTRRGTIEIPGETDTFVFSGTTGDVLNITITQTGGTDTPCWTLYDPTGTAVGGTVCENAALRTLTRTGVHTVLVFEGGHNQTAEYGLTIEALAGTFGGAANGPPTPACAATDVTGTLPPDDGTQPIACGQTRGGTIEVAGETDTFVFSGAVGDVLNIAITQTGGTDTPCWTLYDPTGTAVGDTVCENAGLRTLTRTGVHTVLVFEGGHNQAANYALTIEPLNGTFDGEFNGPPTPLCAAVDATGTGPADDGTQPITCGETRPGSIEVAGETDTYAFFGAAGDVFNLTITQTGGTDTPCWALYDPAGAAVGATVCESTGLRTLTQTGVYTILVFEGGHNQTANYNLGMVPIGTECRCGNTMPDPGESCDDGNRVSGDGCAANCVAEPTGSSTTTTTVTTSTTTTTSSTSTTTKPSTTTTTTLASSTTTSTTATTTTTVSSTTTTTTPGACPGLTVGTVRAYAGGRVRVPVRLDPNGEPVAALNYTAEWRASRAAGRIAGLDTCVPGPATQAANASHQCVPDALESQATVIIVDAGARPIPPLPPGTVSELILDVARNTPGQVVDVCIDPESVAFGDTGGFDLCVAPPTCGRVDIIAGCQVQGDCNCDGRVNSGDRVCLISKFFDPSLRGTCGCEDCNLSGELNAADGVCITLCAFGNCPATGG